MTLFRRKSYVVEAEQWHGSNDIFGIHIIHRLAADGYTILYGILPYEAKHQKIDLGNWIVRDTQIGGIKVKTQQEFHDQYERTQGDD